MFLSQIAQQIATENDLDKLTVEQYRRSADRLSAFLGRTASVADLTVENVNAFIAWLPDRYGIGPQTTRNYRTGILRIWSFAHDPLDACPRPPSKRIRMPKLPQRPVDCWSVDQIQTLAAAAERLAGQLRNGIPAREFMSAWIWLGYETGLRPGDLRLLTWSQIDLETRFIQVSQHKTGQLHVPLFSDSTAAKLVTLRKYGHSRVFPLDKSGVYRWEQILYREAAKDGFARQTRQGIGTLRKTHATEIARQHGIAAASQSLGHRGAVTTAIRHYVSSSVSGRGFLPPSPPRRTA